MTWTTEEELEKVVVDIEGMVTVMAKVDECGDVDYDDAIAKAKEAIANGTATPEWIYEVY